MTSTEAQRLRHDLHDRVGPVLSTLALRLGSLRLHLERGGPQDVGTALELAISLEQDVAEVVEDVRAALRCEDHRRARMISVVRARVDQLNQSRDEPWVELVVHGELGWLPGLPQGIVMLVLGEALTNVARHARASHAHVTLTRQADRLAVEIVDDGTHQDPGIGPGLGVRSMSERVARAGGEFEIAPAPDGGTVVRAWVPCRDEGDAADRADRCRP